MSEEEWQKILAKREAKLNPNSEQKKPKAKGLTK